MGEGGWEGQVFGSLCWQWSQGVPEGVVEVVIGAMDSVILNCTPLKFQKRRGFAYVI